MNNIKRIIFDVDNTLIEWKEEYDIALEKTLEQLGILYNKELINKINQGVAVFESKQGKYEKKEMLKEINNMLQEEKIQLPESSIDIWLNYLSKCVPEEQDKETINALNQLKDKYELVVLSNWFEESQRKRLEKAGMTSYFQEMYFAETFLMKPNAEAFRVAMGNNKPEECIMVGDDYELDIKPSIQMGMQVFYITKQEGLTLPDHCYKISKIKDLLLYL